MTASLRSKVRGAGARRFMGIEMLESRRVLAAIQVYAAGTTNQEILQLHINGATVATWNNLGGDADAGQFATYAFNTATAVTPSQLRLAFTNDLYDPANGIDRNVRIDAISIDGVRYETEAPEVFSTGTWQANDGVTPGYRQSEYLHTNGYFQYASSSNVTTIQVSASGDEGGERGELRVAGALVGRFTVTTAFQTFSYQIAQTVTADQIQVFFTNDVYDLANSIDNNLNVDYVVINGTRYETEAPNVFSTGTWTPEDGIQPGFRLSQTLHTNGYFHYGQDRNPGTLSLSVGAVTVSENQGQLTVVVFRTSGSSGQVSVGFATAAGTATAADFNSTSGTLTFADGMTSASFTVGIIDDTLRENAEQFTVSIFNPLGGAVLGAITSETITISDNDQTSTIVYSEGFETGTFWTVNSAGTDTATAGRWETGSPQQTTSGGVIQLGSGGTGVRALVTGLAAGANADAYDVDGGVTSAISPTINLPVSSNLELRFKYNFAHNTTATIDDYFRFFVQRGTTTQQVLGVSGQSANRFGSWQTARISLSSYSGQSVRLLAQAADNAANSLIEAAIDDVIVEIVPAAPGTFNVAATTMNVSEAAGSAVVNVVRSQGTLGAVSVKYRTLTGTATSSDYTHVSGTLNFANGETTKSVSIPIINDNLQEPLESFRLEIHNAAGGATLGSDRFTTVTIVDNDNTAPDYLPDFAPISATMREQLHVDTTEIPGRRLMRFSTEVANRGAGPLELWGGATSGTTQEVFQRIYQPNNSYRDRLAGNFVYHADHGHVHFEGFATYNLRNSSGSIVASGGKTSFCLINIRQPYPDVTATADVVHGRGGTSCGQIQGLSAGYSDVYSASLDGQWIDITNVPNGTYSLEMTADPDNRILEIDESNNVASISVTIQNGSVSAAVASPGAPVRHSQAYSNRGMGTVVAIIDSGVDLANPQLAQRLWRNTREVPNDRIDNDGNGFVDDTVGYDFVDRDANVSDSNGHGTFVAGLFGSDIGIARDAKLMIVRSLGANGYGTDEAIAQGIRYAVNNGADLINLSLQSGGSLSIVQAVEYARQRGVMIVAAAGNHHSATPSFIAGLSSRYDNVLSVGGLEADGSRMPESNLVSRSGAIQIDATGVAMGTLPGGSFGTYRGTSVAAGFVSAAGALVLSANPALSAAQVRDVLVSTTDVPAPLSDSLGVLQIQPAIDLATGSRLVSLQTVGAQLRVNTSSASDSITVDPQAITINGIRYPVQTTISSIIVNDAGGSDRLRLTGTNGNDTVTINTSLARLQTTSRSVTGYGFEYVTANALWGTDTLDISDTASDDTALLSRANTYVVNNTSYRGGTDFETIRVVASHGFDSATLRGTSGVENFVVRPGQATLNGVGFSLSATGFDSTRTISGGGNDTALLTGSSGNDLVTHLDGITSVTGTGFRFSVVDFPTLQYASGGGNDAADLSDTSGDDRVELRRTGLTFKTPRQQLTINSIRNVIVRSNYATDRDVIKRVHSTLDYLFASFGSWTFE
jgi:Subtilase family/Lysyl oxidase/Calx-beta domain/Ca-dependent carbohydrate-binding module xylan-binding